MQCNMNLWSAMRKPQYTHLGSAFGVLSYRNTLFRSRTLLQRLGEGRGSCLVGSFSACRMESGLAFQVVRLSAATATAASPLLSRKRMRAEL